MVARGAAAIQRVEAYFDCACVGLALLSEAGPDQPAPPAACATSVAAARESGAPAERSRPAAEPQSNGGG